MESSSYKHALLAGSLAWAVPLWQDRIRKHWDYYEEQSKEFADFIGSHGDIILYRSEKKGESAQAFNKLATAIAFASFAPGGIHIFGMHFEAQR